MKKQVLSLFACILILSACDSYRDSPTAADAVRKLNKQLEAGQLNNDRWTNSPEDIARHLFPAASHDGGPERYEVTKTSTSNGTCLVTVLEEGPIDDEVSGEHRTIGFRLSNGKWSIESYQYAGKRH